MNLAEVCIKRPVFTIVLSLVIMIFGVISFERLSVRELPQIDIPVVSITTTYTGASPELIENDITTPIENQLSGLSGVLEMRSNSELGRSTVKIKFDSDVNVSEALDDIRNKLATIRASLPDQADAPVVRKIDRDSRPSLVISFNDSSKDALALTDYLDRNVLPTLEEIDGVGVVNYFGGQNYAVKIWLNATKMAAHSVTVSDVKTALQQQNISVPSGQIKSVNRNYTVITDAKFKRPDHFNNIVISNSNGYITRLSDVARVEVTAENADSEMRVNGTPAVGLAIIPQSTANPVMVSKLVEKRIKQLKINFPATLQYKIVYDAAIYINQSIHDVFITLLEAITLVLIVVWLFLGSFRSASIPIVTVPICLLAVFWPMLLLGYSINTITLLAIVLAIGLVVDDAIVMLENIFRHIQAGLSPLQAAITGSREIVFAIIAMTLTLAAVYAPLGFAKGMTGQLFRQFGFTLSAAVIISGFVALTLSPMMSAYVLPQQHDKTRLALVIGSLFTRITEFYRKILVWALRYRNVVLLVVSLFAVIGYFVHQRLPSELAPQADTGIIFGVVTAPTDSSYSYTDRYVKQIEALYDKIPERQASFAFVGGDDPASAFTAVILKPWQQRSRSQADITAQLQQLFQQIPGVNAFAVSPSPLGRHASDNHAFNLVLMTAAPYQRLNELMEQVKKMLAGYPGLTNVDTDLMMSSQQFRVNIDRDLAADINVNLSDVAAVISTMLGGSHITDFQYDGKGYQVLMQLDPNDQNDLSVLNQLTARNSAGKMIPLSSLIKISPNIGPTSLPHYNRLRSASLSAELAPGYTMGQVITDLRALMKKDLPSDASYEFAGTAKDYLTSQGESLVAFLLALVFIYLVLAAQFESFIDPLIILLTVPFSIVGALLTLKLVNGSINIYSNIGMVTLIGLIAKHGILITEFANQLQRQGKSQMDAIVEAAVLRLRPILMTTAAMVLGAVPLALASGAGAEARQQIGWVIVGGLLIGTFFSLIVVPTAYLLLSRKQTGKI